MIFKSKIKWVAIGGLALSFVSLLAHMFLANTSTELVEYNVMTGFVEDLNINAAGKQGVASRKLWKKVKSLEALQPYANPRNKFPVPQNQNNGFIHAKIFGGFEKIRSSICDLVTISRLLNATLVIPEIQESTNSKGIGSEFKSFSYVYNVDHFITSLRSDVIIVKDLPPELKAARKRKACPIFKPQKSASLDYYIKKVLPKLKQGKLIGLVVVNGGCLQEYLVKSCSSLLDYDLSKLNVLNYLSLDRDKLRASGQPYLAYHLGLVRDALAYQGCADLFQDVHTELIQYRRAQMIKQKLVHDELSIDSYVQKVNGLCPLMPEEVGFLLRAMGYPSTTRIYLAGSESFGGQRVMIPLRAMYTNLVDRSNLCNKYELNKLLGTESPLPVNHTHVETAEELKKERGPHPQPQPPPPGRRVYQHEKEGWHGWIGEKESEPDPSPIDLRDKAHRLLWDALDYVVSVEADAFFPGFNNDGTGSDFSSLVMGHRLYQMASSRTYRPDRKFLAKLFNSSSNLYFPKRSWTVAARDHLHNSLGEAGLKRQFLQSKLVSFLSHPIPECTCTTMKPIGDHHECPKWLKDSVAKSHKQQTPTTNENEQPDHDDDDEVDEFQSDSEDEKHIK